MRGVLQTTLLCFTWTPLLRRLIAVGTALILACQLGLLLLKTQGPVFFEFLTVVLSLAFITTSVMLATGVMWRSISAPRTLSLVPHARLKLLVGVVVTQVLLATLVMANVALFHLEAPATPDFPGSLPSIFVGVLGVTAAVTLLLFLLSGAPYVAMALVAVAWFRQSLWSQLAVASGLHARIGTMPLLAAMTAVAWSVFGVWYLRAKRIAPPSWGGVRPRVARRLRIAEIDVSQSSAIGVQLVGPSPFARSRKAGLFIGAGVALLLWRTAVAPSTAHSVMATLALCFLLLLVSVFVFKITAALAGNSRALWLRSGCSRDQLFLICERLAWRCLGAGVAPVLLVLILAWAFPPRPSYNCGYLLLQALALSVCNLYVGLTSVRGATLRLYLEALTAIVSWGLLMLSALVTVTPAMQAIPIALLLGAIALRWIAQVRWRQLDWLICKPARLSRL